MRGLAISGIMFGVCSALIAVILVLSGGKFMAVSEGWARAANLSFLFAIACSLIKSGEKKE
ncbi:hypothetical protein ACFLUV_00110 [Elusimicrobiota bacterium]